MFNTKSTNHDELIIPAFEASRTRSRHTPQARKEYDRKPKHCWSNCTEKEAA